MTGATIESVDVVAPAGDLIEKLHTRGYLLGLEVARAIGPGHPTVIVFGEDRVPNLLHYGTAYSGPHGVQVAIFASAAFDICALHIPDVIDEWVKAMGATAEGRA